MSHIGTVNVFLFQYNEYFYGQGLIAYSKIFIALFLALYLILVFLVLMILYSLSDNIKFSNEMISLITLLIIGGIFMIITSDVFVSFISLELMSLIIYVIIALDKSVSPSIESSVKYFILGSFVSTMSVSGICILYLILGTSELGLSTIIINCSKAEPFIYISGALIILLICALLFKLGVPPFHL